MSDEVDEKGAKRLAAHEFAQTRVQGGEQALGHGDVVALAGAGGEMNDLLFYGHSLHGSPGTDGDVYGISRSRGRTMPATRAAVTRARLRLYL